MKKYTALFVIISLLSLPLLNFGQTDDFNKPGKLPDYRGRGESITSPKKTPLDKLSPELRILEQQFARGRGGEPGGADETGLNGFSAEQLKKDFGIEPNDSDPSVTVSIKYDSANLERLKKSGFKVYFQTKERIYGTSRISDLGKIVALEAVKSVNPFKAMRLPDQPDAVESPRLISFGRGGVQPTTAKPANEFNKQNLTGKGVIIGVIDSGIDWKHQDFIRPDGTSRILAIWDLLDDSFTQSGGKIGSVPPTVDAVVGTVYTNAQINDALKGKGTVNSADQVGHGTAVAGTAAGNGRATANGVPAGFYQGVAPDADILVVKGGGCAGLSSLAQLSALWMTETAQKLKKPIVINISFGSQFSSHTGTEEGEQLIDYLAGDNVKGVAVTVAAGNENLQSLHARARFGKNNTQQVDTFSQTIGLTVRKPTSLLAVFNSEDDWGFSFKSGSSEFLGKDGQPVAFYITKKDGTIDIQKSGDLKSKETENALGKLFSIVFEGNKDKLFAQLPAGQYNIWGFGKSENVIDGKFDLYLPDGISAAFMNNVVKESVILSPGNAKNAITVGSFDFRNTWENVNGQTTAYNLTIGELSEYSNFGYRLDGLIKPDIISPAQYTISPLSEGSKQANGGCENSLAKSKSENITKDGFHIAWSGTSASAPFTAGVAALMLQANPNLTTAQIKEIFKRTAFKDDSVIGKTPNKEWGYGRINPEAAVRSAFGLRTITKTAGRKAK